MSGKENKVFPQIPSTKGVSSTLHKIYKKAASSDVSLPATRTKLPGTVASSPFTKVCKKAASSGVSLPPPRARLLLKTTARSPKLRTPSRKRKEAPEEAVEGNKVPTTVLPSKVPRKVPAPPNVSTKKESKIMSSTVNVPAKSQTVVSKPIQTVPLKKNS